MRLGSQSLAGTTPVKVKTDDRKRPQMSDREDPAPPPRRQATQSNGTKAELDPFMDRDRVIEEFTKDAILRQKDEYKRQKQDLEKQLADAKDKMKYHDGHLRVHDLWFSQLVDEIRILANDTIPTVDPQSSVKTPFPTSLLFSDADNFQSYLSKRTEDVKASLSELFTRIPASSPDVQQLQSKLSEVLAMEKQHAAKLHQTIAEKEQLSNRLENATERYVLAERRYDRERSKAVAMVGLGAFPMPAAAKEESSREKVDSPPTTNGSALHGDELLAQKKSAVIAEQRKTHCEQLVAENEKLTKEVTSLNTRLYSLTDDDYAKTDLFKMIKTQYEDIIKRINDKEATNLQLREELQKLQAERTEYRNKVEDESKEAISERESQLARTEQDLTRVRHTRDELASELAIKKASQEESKVSSDQIKELASAGENRIAALETEVERLRIKIGQVQPSEPSQELDSMSEEEVRSKIKSIRKEYELLSNELPSMEAAWKKAQKLAQKKIAEVVGWEEQVQRLTAEKAKADQKYFAAMKSKDARDSELRVLRNQNGRSSEIIASSKASEKEHQSYKIKMEHQLAEGKELLNKLTDQNRAFQQKVTEQNNSLESAKSQITELKNALNAKDATVLAAKHAKRQLEVENEKIKVELRDTEKQLHDWKDKGAKDEMSEMWRQYALCPVCHTNFKNATIKTCAHVMCWECIDTQYQTRSRKCPLDGKAFALTDVMKLNM